MGWCVSSPSGAAAATAPFRGGCFSSSSDLSGGDSGSALWLMVDQTASVWNLGKVARLHLAVFTPFGGEIWGLQERWLGEAEEGAW